VKPCSKILLRLIEFLGILSTESISLSGTNWFEISRMVRRSTALAHIFISTESN